MPTDNPQDSDSKPEWAKKPAPIPDWMNAPTGEDSTPLPAEGSSFSAASSRSSQDSRQSESIPIPSWMNEEQSPSRSSIPLPDWMDSKNPPADKISSSTELEIPSWMDEGTPSEKLSKPSADFQSLPSPLEESNLSGKEAVSHPSSPSQADKNSGGASSSPRLLKVLLLGIIPFAVIGAGTVGYLRWTSSVSSAEVPTLNIPAKKSAKVIRNDHVAPSEKSSNNILTSAAPSLSNAPVPIPANLSNSIPQYPAISPLPDIEISGVKYTSTSSPTSPRREYYPPGQFPSNYSSKYLVVETLQSPSAYVDSIFNSLYKSLPEGSINNPVKSENTSYMSYVASSEAPDKNSVEWFLIQASSEGNGSTVKTFSLKESGGESKDELWQKLLPKITSELQSAVLSAPAR